MGKADDGAKRSVLWFRKGLRLHDNAALLQARIRVAASHAVKNATSYLSASPVSRESRPAARVASVLCLRIIPRRPRTAQRRSSRSSSWIPRWSIPSDAVPIARSSSSSLCATWTSHCGESQVIMHS